MQALRTALERILRLDPEAAVITMGDMNSTPDERMLRDVLGPVEEPANFTHSPHARDCRRELPYKEEEEIICDNN